MQIETRLILILHLLNGCNANMLALWVVQGLGEKLKEVAQVLQKDFGNSLKQGVQAVNADLTMSGVGAIAALVQELKQFLPFAFGYIDPSNSRNNSSSSMENQAPMMQIADNQQIWSDKHQHRQIQLTLAHEDRFLKVLLEWQCL